MTRAVVLTAAVDAAPVLVFVADSEMRYLAVNEYACEVLGYTEEELLELRVPDVATYDEAPGEYSSMVETGYRAGTSRLRSKDGEEVVMKYVAGQTVIDGAQAFVAVGWIQS